MTAIAHQAIRAATLRTGLGPYMRVRIDCALPPSPYLWRYLARITEKPAPAASFENTWSQRKSLSGGDAQFVAKISCWQIQSDRLGRVWNRS